MMADAHLPDLEDRIEFYLAIWETVETDEFTIDGLRRAGVTPNDDRTAGAARPTLRHQLDTLVACGLLDRRGDDRYRVRMTPEESIDDWVEKTTSRVSVLYETVTELTRNRADDVSHGSESDTIQFEGETYATTTVTTEMPFETVVEELSGREDVALCSPADEAGHVQQLADRLCDDDVMTDRRGSFEKVNSQVLGSDPDHLEYRLYLTR